MFKKLKALLFENQTDRQTVLKNTIWLFVGELGVRALKILIFIYAARILAAREWGVFSYAIAVMSLSGKNPEIPIIRDM